MFFYKRLMRTGSISSDEETGGGDGVYMKTSPPSSSQPLLKTNVSPRIGKYLTDGTVVVVKSENQKKSSHRKIVRFPLAENNGLDEKNTFHVRRPYEKEDVQQKSTGIEAIPSSTFRSIFTTLLKVGSKTSDTRQTRTEAVTDEYGKLPSVGQQQQRSRHYTITATTTTGRGIRSTGNRLSRAVSFFSSNNGRRTNKTNHDLRQPNPVVIANNALQQIK